MGSPLHQLVRCSGVLSPRKLSPRLLTLPKSLRTPSPNKLQVPNAPYVNSHLENAKSFVSEFSDNDLGVSFLSDGISEDTQSVPKFKLTADQSTHVSKFRLKVNTPERKNILEFGVISQPGLTLLGRGAFGSVVEGIYKGRTVAVKVVKMRSENCSLDREQNALRLSHPHIVQTMLVIKEPAYRYGIVLMEHYVGCTNLQRLLEENSIAITPIYWSLQLAHALNYCHCCGILHLDIKPKNVLVCNGSCKLCDFGSSVALDKPHQRIGVQGTVAYAAPELFQSKEPDFSADVYSLGITIWQMKTKEVPYEGMDCAEVIIYNVVKRNMRPILPSSELCRYFKLCKNCWSADSSLRPKITAIIDELEDIAQTRTD